MTDNQETSAEVATAMSPAAAKYDRRILVRRGVTLSAGVAGASTLARLGLAAQEDTSTPDATGASPAAASTEQEATPGIVTVANAFLGTLSDTEKASVLFDWTDTDQKQRWSNFPAGAFDRAGLMWGDLGQEQQSAWLQVMQATLSAEGYDRVRAEWNADDALAGTEGNGGGGGGGASFGTAYYYIALIGTPSETDPWQWQFGGHHVTINATVVGSTISLTPSFIGVQPFSYTDANGTTVRPLGDIEDEAFALINALDDTQQQTAILGDTPIDLVLGPGQDGKTIQAEGLPASEMTDDQRDAFVQLIGHYAGLINAEDATSRMKEISADLDETYLAWYGPTTEGSAAYFRVTGPRVVIEYSPQGDRGASAPSSGEYHIHGIYRDPSNDYGTRYTGIEIES